MRPSESQVEAAKLLIRMLEKDGEPVDDALRAVAQAEPAPNEISSAGAEVQGRGLPTSESNLTPAEHEKLLRFIQPPQSTRKIAGKPRRLRRIFKLGDSGSAIVVLRPTKRIRIGIVPADFPSSAPTVAAAVDAANRVERERIAGERAARAKPRH